MDKVPQNEFSTLGIENMLEAMSIVIDESKAVPGRV